jgi:hypothetical protein
MLDEVAPKIGVRMLSETVRANAREGDMGMELGEIATANPEVAIGSYPFFDPQNGPNMNVVLRARDPQKLAFATRSRTCWSECGEHNRSLRFALSRRKQGFESPRERQLCQLLSSIKACSVASISNFSPIDSASPKISRPPAIVGSGGLKRLGFSGPTAS